MTNNKTAWHTPENTDARIKIPSLSALERTLYLQTSPNKCKRITYKYLFSPLCNVETICEYLFPVSLILAIILHFTIGNNIAFIITSIIFGVGLLSFTITKMLGKIL